MLRATLLSASRSEPVRTLVENAPISRSVVRRFVPGTSVAEAVNASAGLVASGRLVSLDRLGEDTTDREHAEATRDSYLELLRALGEAGLTHAVEVSVKLSAVGQFLTGDGEKIALENTRAICESATSLGTTVTIDMEDHTTTDSTLSILRQLRVDFPDTGAVVQSYLRRTAGDCRDLSGPRSRVRLCKGAYNEPESVAFRDKEDVDLSYVRCLKILMAGQGYPMVASHDPRLVEIAGTLAVRHGRSPGGYEYQMLYGVRPEEQKRLAAAGERLRVYTPYGDEWYGYFMRRLAERPANVGFFLRSLVTRG